MRFVLLALVCASSLLFSCAHSAHGVDAEDARSDISEGSTRVLITPLSAEAQARLQQGRQTSAHREATSLGGASAVVDVSNSRKKSAQVSTDSDPHGSDVVGYDEISLSYPSASGHALDMSMEATWNREYELSSFANIEGKTATVADINSGLLVDSYSSSFETILAITKEIQSSVEVYSRLELFADSAVKVDGRVVLHKSDAHTLSLSLSNTSEAAALPAPNRIFHIVIDRSSSMKDHWSALIHALNVLRTTLAPTDQIRVVTYNGYAREEIPLTDVGSLQGLEKTLGEIHVEGASNLEAGLRLAYDHPSHGEHSRVILVSDGAPNVGAFYARDFSPLVEEAFEAKGIVTSTIGIGDSFDANILTQIAESGHGEHHVAEINTELDTSFTEEVEADDLSAITNFEIEIVLPPGVRAKQVKGIRQQGRRLWVSVPQLRRVHTTDIEIELIGHFDADFVVKEISYQRVDEPIEIKVDRHLTFAITEEYIVEQLFVETLERVQDGLAANIAVAPIAIQYLNGVRKSPLWQTSPKVRQRTHAVGRMLHGIDVLSVNATMAERRKLVAGYRKMFSQVRRGRKARRFDQKSDSR